ncbi:sensor histidine kinase [Actinoallomurus spadix]|uniref:histidine kinase n=1 Tax=Actinoallomurus spadix TaxID=79912 RepID=A0ABP3GW66_9ACTN|nr:sensor histidine kinase [Actinoallomurus spadix]MCO5986017.1 sensor histidine kinase [Actinoallomurus spadix]
MRDLDPPPVFPRRLSRGRLIALDAVAAAGSALVLLAVALTRPVGLPVWTACLLAAAIGLPVAVRRLWPLLVFGVVFTATLPALYCGMGWAALFVAAFALYMVALTEPRHPREPTLVIAGISAVGVLVGTMAGPSEGSGVADLIIVGPPVLGGAWTIGRAVRERRAYAERSARQLADHAVTEERLRIARELHDVVSHTLSLIGVKAGVAGYVLESRSAGGPDPGGEVRDALRVIETTSREALVEMRHMLGMLRSDDASPDLRPAPDLAGLPELRDRAAAAGVRVDLTVDGADGLPDGLGRSVYRIVQEAVTNVVRHAAPAHCRVVVAGDADEVCIRVTDNGPGGRVLPGAPGHGIIGMRERALMHGGTLTAGPRPEGGFEVSARLPRHAPEDP